MVELIKGKGSELICNGYLIEDIVIDAPINSEPPSAELLVITHPHCDHFIGAANYAFKKAASNHAKDLINSKKDEFCLCKYVGWNFPEIKIDLGLKDGETIERKNTKLEVVYTPGHCEGAICLYEPNKKFLFSGDTVLSDHNLPRTDLPSSDLEKLRDSYEKLIQLEIETIYPGHGGIIREKDYVKNLLLNWVV